MAQNAGRESPPYQRFAKRAQKPKLVWIMPSVGNEGSITNVFVKLNEQSKFTCTLPRRENGDIYTKSYWSTTIWKTLRNPAVLCRIRHGIIKKCRVLRHKKREKQDEQHRKCRINPTPSLNPTPYPSPEITNKQRDFQGLV